MVPNQFTIRIFRGCKRSDQIPSNICGDDDDPRHTPYIYLLVFQILDTAISGVGLLLNDTHASGQVPVQ